MHVAELRQMLDGRPVSLTDRSGKRVALPRAVQAEFKAVVDRLESGAALSTQQAADLLGVSRPYFVKLLEAGELPFHRAGNHRRVYSQDVAAYARRRDASRRKILRQMSRNARAAGLYDRTMRITDGSDE
jgi:excisionase family DNA binding protein